MPELLILLSILIATAESAIVKRYQVKHGKGGFIFTAILALFAMIFFLATDPDGFSVPPVLWGYAIPAGFSYAAAFICTLIAFGCGPFALSNLIISYALVFTTVYGLAALGEPATVFTYSGLAAIFISLFLVRSEKKGGKFSVKWLISIFIVWLGNGMLGLLRVMQQKKFHDAYNNDFMVIMLFTALVLLLAAGLIHDRKDLRNTLRYGIPWGAAAGVLNAAQNALSMLVVTLMPVSISSPLTAGLKIIVAFLFSYLAYKERYSKRQLLGVALGIAAVVLLKL